MILLVFVLLVVGVFEFMGWDEIPSGGEAREEEVDGTS